MTKRKLKTFKFQLTVTRKKVNGKVIQFQEVFTQKTGDGPRTLFGKF